MSCMLSIVFFTCYAWYEDTQHSNKKHDTQHLVFIGYYAESHLSECRALIAMPSVIKGIVMLTIIYAGFVSLIVLQNVILLSAEFFLLLY
jgi:hypothetical protein